VRALAGELSGALVQLAVIGLLAIGVSGLVAMGMRATLGARFVAGDVAGVTYTHQRCADLAEYHPEAGTCTVAAALHHADEVETYRIAAGVLGLVGGAALALHAHRGRARRRSAVQVAVLPEAFTATSGAVLFGAAGGLLLVQSLGVMVGGGMTQGAGQW